jgi:hypothetical protein
MQDWVKVHQSRFTATRSDIIVLATDALAQWIMRMSEQKIRTEFDPWRELFILRDNAIGDFKQFVDHQRRTGAMEIDDTTLMIIGLYAEQDNNTILM